MISAYVFCWNCKIPSYVRSFTESRLHNGKGWQGFKSTYNNSPCGHKLRYVSVKVFVDPNWSILSPLSITFVIKFSLRTKRAKKGEKSIDQTRFLFSQVAAPSTHRRPSRSKISIRVFFLSLRIPTTRGWLRIRIKSPQHFHIKLIISKGHVDRTNRKQLERVQRTETGNMLGLDTKSPSVPLLHPQIVPTLHISYVAK